MRERVVRQADTALYVTCSSCFREISIEEITDVEYNEEEEPEYLCSSCAHDYINHRDNRKVRNVDVDLAVRIIHNAIVGGMSNDEEDRAEAREFVETDYCRFLLDYISEARGYKKWSVDGIKKVWQDSEDAGICGHAALSKLHADAIDAVILDMCSKRDGCSPRIISNKLDMERSYILRRMKSLKRAGKLDGPEERGVGAPEHFYRTK